MGDGGAERVVALTLALSAAAGALVAQEDGGETREGESHETLSLGSHCF